jgi:hypothetical protein
MSKASFDDSADYNNCPICQNDVCEPEIDTEMTELMQSNGSTKTAYIKGKEPFVRCKRSGCTGFFLFLILFPHGLHVKETTQCEADNVNQCVTKRKWGAMDFFYI